MNTSRTIAADKIYNFSKLLHNLWYLKVAFKTRRCTIKSNIQCLISHCTQPLHISVLLSIDTTDKSLYIGGAGARGEIWYIQYLLCVTPSFISYSVPIKLVQVSACGRINIWYSVYEGKTLYTLGIDACCVLNLEPLVLYSELVQGSRTHAR